MIVKNIFLGMLFLIIAFAGFSQSLPESSKIKIDSLFKKWDNLNSPGCVVGIVRNDSLIYARGYGLANLEDNTSNTPQSIYYMCSVSKQFTGYVITLLARQGKLKLDEDIHTYLPWMADFGKKITIRNLLNHTSGIRDDIDMARISGLSIEGILTQELALNILKKQRSLNFIPGEKFSYSNSNYVLLAEIARVVSGQSFASLAEDAIFKPLGMKDSRFVDNNQEIIKGRTASYSYNSIKSLKNSSQNVYTLGDGGLFTNINDMAHWVMNFYSPQSGDAKDIEQLTEKGKLNNGKEINYALGINVDKSRGWKRFIHNGGLAGYRTIIAVYPDLKIGFIVFGNSGDNEIYTKIDQLAVLFIPDISNKVVINQPIIRKDSLSALLKNPDSIKKLTGDYIAENGYRLKFSIINDKLRMNQNNLLVNDSGNTFSLLTNPAVKYAFHVNKKEISVDLFSPVLSQPIHLIKFLKDTLLSDKVLQTYTGTYYCPELDCSYHIVLIDHQLFLTNNLYADSKITLLGKDHLITDYDFLYHLHILKMDEKIIGFELNNGEIMHLRFNKID